MVVGEDGGRKGLRKLLLAVFVPVRVTAVRERVSTPVPLHKALKVSKTF